MKQIEDDTNGWKDIQCPWIGRIKELLKWPYFRSQSIDSVQVLSKYQQFFTELEQIILKCVWKVWKVKVLVAQLCLTLCDPMAWSPPGFSVHGILQARILEWVTIPFSRGSSQPRDQTQVSCIGRQILYCLSHQGSPCVWKSTSISI